MKVKGEPGPYLPYEEVIKKLTAAAYGANDLVDLGLFHSEHFVRDAISSGKIKFQKVNKRAVVFCRDDILEYWIKYRNQPYEPANNTLRVNLTISEVDYICALTSQAKKRVDREFSINDLFRNIIKNMMARQINFDELKLFITH